MIVYKFRQSDMVYDGPVELPDSPTIPRYHTFQAPPEKDGYYAVMNGGWVLVAGQTPPPPPPPDETPIFNAQQKQSRLKAYEKESDPLFFKAQRGEATMQEWQDKVAEIKARFPYKE